jgi:deoxyribose-phosphate aldolase
MEPVELAPLIDHTLLRAEASDADILRLAAEAAEHGFAAVCVNSRHVPLAARALAGTSVRVATVTGFPLGASHPAAKAAEAALAVRLGATEVDMVLSIGDLLAGERARVRDDIAEVRRAVPGAVLKVILECALLPPPLRREGALIAVEAGADFVKTSTGFAPGGATVEDVRLLRETVGSRVGVKASGGIRTFAAAAAMVRAGANRLGTSSGVTIVTASGPST